jgi:hypothetical protein
MTLIWDGMKPTAFCLSVRGTSVVVKLTTANCTSDGSHPVHGSLLFALGIEI